MGKAISSLVWTAIQPFRNYNIEQRALKFVSQNKVRPAPKFEATRQELEKILEGEK